MKLEANFGQNMGRNPELSNGAGTLFKFALLGLGAWMLSRMVTYEQLLAIAARKDPKLARSIRDAVSGDPSHYGRIYDEAQFIDEGLAEDVINQTSYAVRRGKGKPHNLLITLLARASPNNFASLDE